MNADVEEVVADAAFVKGKQQGKEEMLEWMEEYCKTHGVRCIVTPYICIQNKELLEAAKKQASEK
jgi:hypothetical protein